jgi:hypothetical protein
MRNGKLHREGAALTRQQNTSAREQYQSALMIRTDAGPQSCLAYTFLKYHPPHYASRSATLCTVPGKRRTTFHYDWVLGELQASRGSVFMMKSSPSCLSKLHPQRYFRAVIMLLIFIATGLLWTTSFGLGFPSNEFWDTGLDRRSPVPPLEVFQVEAPLRASYDGASCHQVIVQHNFENSWSPYIGTVPSNSMLNQMLKEQRHIPRQRTVILPPRSSTSQSRLLVSIMIVLASYSWGILKYGGPQLQCQ